MQLPQNNALRGLCAAMVEAWRMQGKPNAAILFVVENVTYNICDQVIARHTLHSIFVFYFSCFFCRDFTSFKFVKQIQR